MAFSGWPQDTPDDVAVSQFARATQEMLTALSSEDLSASRTVSVHGFSTGEGTRVKALLPLITPPSVRQIPSSKRYASAMPASTAAHRPFGLPVMSRRRICSISEATIATSGSSRPTTRPRNMR